MPVECSEPTLMYGSGVTNPEDEDMKLTTESYTQSLGTKGRINRQFTERKISGGSDDRVG